MASPATALNLNITATAVGEWLDSPLDGSPDTFIAGITNTLSPISNDIETRGFYEFNLGGAPSTITQATLKLGPVKASGFSQCGILRPCPTVTSVAIHAYAGDGVITAGDWGAGSLVSNAALPADGQIFMLDVTSAVQALLTNGDPFAGFSSVGTQAGTVSFSTVPASGTFELMIVPEPNAVLLQVSILGAAALTMRRRRTSRRIGRSAR